MSTESPVLTLPKDPEWVAELEQKKRDYERRTEKTRYQAPELRNTQAAYSLLILTKVFSGSPVLSHALSRELFDLQQEMFDRGSFEQACTNISAYTTDRDVLRQHLPAKTN